MRAPLLPETNSVSWQSLRQWASREGMRSEPIAPPRRMCLAGKGEMDACAQRIGVIACTLTELCLWFVQVRLDRKALRLLRMEDAVTLASVKEALLVDPGVRRVKVKKSDITCAPPPSPLSTPTSQPALALLPVWVYSVPCELGLGEPDAQLVHAPGSQGHGKSTSSSTAG